MKVHVCRSSVLFLSLLMATSLRGQEVPSPTQQKPVVKPVRRVDQVATNDPIALLAMRSTSATLTSDSAASSDSSTANETSRKAAELSSIERQIKEKQERIVFLMRLFVDDERAFVNDPGNTNVLPTTADRRRDEQDELHWETAELARLKARLRELTASR